MGDDSKTASAGFRWLVLARSAVALMVTVLAALVVVKGLLLVARPGLIELNISHSNVFARKVGTGKDTTYYFRFYLQATNPSELVFLYYRNITVQLFDTTPNPGPPPSPSTKLLAKFSLSPSALSLSQKEEQEYLVFGSASDKDVTAIAVQKLFKDDHAPATIENAVMVLRGFLAFDDIKQGRTTVKYSAKFNCEPVTVKSNTALSEPSSGNLRADCLQA